MDLADITYFFDCCIGQWSIERTYHYMAQQEIERSHTDFRVDAITPDLRRKVLTDNGYGKVDEIDSLPGFQLAFHTVSDKGEEVTQELRALFVPQQQVGTVLRGDYLRDRAYEEDRPIISSFTYDQSNRELLMTTPYTKVVSVDSILLVNPTTRIRRILNYKRPADGEPLDSLVLVGFGVEQKVSG
ncbi:MAG: phycobiliprotein lyase [Leptolyngbya sp.]|uniref:Chromophore lyase CpcS/CpeS n=1 Tax=Shackletoniella antarctica TaxID=268115 RepID=A0A2W4WFV1_9CYAN|nr:MAG: phycobiliprotein lyase [Shackletoniella antarctica]PZV22313.1 MAG: phycobiliprotein lyase [Leptolyngbya sp.]